MHTKHIYTSNCKIQIQKAPQPYRDYGANGILILFNFMENCARMASEQGRRTFYGVLAKARVKNILWSPCESEGEVS